MTSGEVSRPGTEPARKRQVITCSGCDVTWTAASAAHCGGCHRTFATVQLFDAHRSAEGEHGSCLHPDDVRGRDGKPRLWFRDGMWRGPELTEEQREKLRIVWGGEAGDPIPA